MRYTPTRLMISMRRIRWSVGGFVGTSTWIGCHFSQKPQKTRSKATEDKIERLLAMASQCLDTDRDLFYLLIDAFIELRKTREKARKELSWYPAIPPDAPSSCRCENTENHSLPPELARQMVELP